MARKKLPATYDISPELVEIRDAQAERESKIPVRAVREKVTLDQKLEEERKALIEAEKRLADQSVSEPFITR